MASRFPGASGSTQVQAKGSGPTRSKNREPGDPVRDRVQTVKKFDAGSNRKAAAAPVNARKLEEGTEPAEVRLMIQKARLGKKMSQAELANQINERTQVVQEYENGKAVLNQAVLGKIEIVLGVKLRGKPAK